MYGSVCPLVYESASLSECVLACASESRLAYGSVYASEYP